MVRVSCRAVHVSRVYVHVKQVCNILQISILNLIFKEKRSVFPIVLT